MPPPAERPPAPLDGEQRSGGATATATVPAVRVEGDGQAGGSAVLGLERPASEVSSLAERWAPWLERSWWTAAGVVILLWGVELVGYISSFPWLTGPVVVLSLWGLGTILASWLPAGARLPSIRSTTLAWATVAMVVAGLACWTYLQVYQTPAYGTDEIAFDQYAAHLLVHGLNPYAHSMAPAFALFHVQPNGYTFHLNGSPVTTLSYPALAFLPYVPFLALGLSSQVATAVNVAAWAVVIVLMFVLLPRPLRPMALVVGSLSVFVAYSVGGITDTLFLPFLVGAVVAWDRFPWQHGPRAWVGPVLLGLAMAVKQTPWFVFPFLVVGVAAEALPKLGWQRALGVGGRYAGLAIGAFLVPNLAFIAMSPTAWARGVLTPLLSSNVPSGQGTVALSLYLHIGGGSLFAYGVATVVVLVALVAIFAVTYPALRRWAVLLPAVVLFFAARSYGNYLVDLVPAALVGAVTVAAPPGGRRWRRWPWVVGGSTAAAAGAVGVALLLPSPLSLAVTSVTTTGQLATVEQVQVHVRNRTDSTVRPYFTISSGDAVTAFWLVRSGPATLRPRQQASYTLQSPNFPAQPPITGGFQVVAFTTSPAAVSHSGSYLPTTYHVALVPDAINHVVPVGEAVTVQAEVLNAVDRPVHRAGIPVYMGQIVYAQRGLQYGEAIIDSGQPGQTPITSYTNADGVATFTIRGTQVMSDPVYFEANLINGTQYYPYGYSQILPIRFSSGSTAGAGG